MFRKALCTALVSGLLAVGFAAPGTAVELRKTPYLPSLQPARPPVPNLHNGTTINGSDIPVYRNGEAVDIHPSTRSQVKSFGPSVNHIQWCANRYRSYRNSDDTYQPLAGPRVSCNSPFQ